MQDRVEAMIQTELLRCDQELAAVAARKQGLLELRWKLQGGPVEQSSRPAAASPIPTAPPPAPAPAPAPEPEESLDYPAFVNHYMRANGRTSLTDAETEHVWRLYKGRQRSQPAMRPIQPDEPLEPSPTVAGVMDDLDEVAALRAQVAELEGQLRAQSERSDRQQEIEARLVQEAIEADQEEAVGASGYTVSSFSAGRRDLQGQLGHLDKPRK